VRERRPQCSPPLARSAEKLSCAWIGFPSILPEAAQSRSCEQAGKAIDCPAALRCRFRVVLSGAKCRRLRAHACCTRALRALDAFVASADVVAAWVHESTTEREGLKLVSRAQTPAARRRISPRAYSIRGGGASVAAGMGLSKPSPSSSG